MVAALVGGLVVSAGASTATGATSRPRYALKSYTKPTWWQKLQTVSAPGFGARAATLANGIAVAPNVDVSNEVTPQSETSIAVDPSDPSHLVAGSNEIVRLPMRGYFSSDGGATWGGVDLPLPPPLTVNGVDFGSDPGVAWDSNGNVYYSYIVVFFSSAFNHSAHGVAINGTEMAVARSSDGGKTWTSTFFGLHRGEGKFNDKPMIAVDTNPGSPNMGTVYVTWDITSGSSSTTGIMISRSTDHGVTFSAPAHVSPVLAGPHFGFGADPFVAPDGSLHVAWNGSLDNQLNQAVSTDGGRTFSAPVTIAPTVVPFAVNIPAQNVRGADLYPTCAADQSAGPNRGNLYCAWNDLNGPSGMDVLFSRSTDGGATWSAPAVVNDDTPGVGNDQFFPWLAVDPTDGSINVSFYDTRNDPTHVSTDVFYARSTDGGISFGPNVRVTTEPTNETTAGANLGNQYGDYEGIAAFGGVIHPVWTDRRASLAPNLAEEVFTAAITP